LLQNIRVVLVNTSHPGNIGGVARAMKNMGLEKQIEELKDEIKELYEYAEMQNDRFSAEETQSSTNRC